MREIKFRLRIGNEIVGYEKWDIGTGDNAGWFYCKNPNGKYPDNVWRRDYIYHTKRDQFTGLHDKNGKEIYEGDIIGTGFWHHTVEFRDGAFKLGEDNLAKLLGGQAKIIGNIYENPKLLKSGK